MKVSVLYITLNRYPSCIDKLYRNLRAGGLKEDEYEILWCDNGSEHQETIAKAMPKVAYSHLNKYNGGVARSLNQLILRAKGDYIIQLGNDYRMPQDWIKLLIEQAEKTPKAGMIGIPWCEQHISPGKYQAYNKPMFGCKLKTRAMLDQVGAYDEKLHPYGLEDSDYHRRSFLAGFNNCYIKGALAVHEGGDVGTQTPYRHMKDVSILINDPYFANKDYKRFGYYIPWPALQEPLK